MKVALDIISFFILLAPTVWEYRDDMHGDTNKKKDVLIRIAIGAVSSGLNWLMTGIPIYASAFMCFALFFLIFDYAIASRFAPDKPFAWFNYLSKKGWFDGIGWWKNMNPWYRFGLRIGVFIIAAIIYF